MEGNCSMDTDWDWEKKASGMSFNDDDKEKESNPYSGIISTIESIRSEIHYTGSVSPFDSSASDTNVIDDTEKIRGLPDFMFSKLFGESEYKPKAELRIASLRSSKLPSHPDEFDTLFTTTNALKVTMQGFLLGSEVTLEGFRTLSAKKALLLKAIEINDGNAITAVSLFLQQTLRDSLFQLILLENNAAASHYIRYLETKCEAAKLADTLCMLGRTEDALNFRYKTIIRGTYLDRLQAQLSHFYTAECRNSDEYMAGLVQNHLSLIEIHKLLPPSEEKPTVPVRLPSVLATLKYLTEHYYDKDPSFALSPFRFSITHKLSTKQHAWTCFLGLSKVQKWPQIESLLIKKGWLGSLQGILPADDVCKILKEQNAPIDLLSMFVSLIDNWEQKLSTAKQLQCHKVVIDMLASKKDKSGILIYKEKLEAKSKDTVYADNVLRTMK